MGGLNLKCALVSVFMLQEVLFVSSSKQDVESLFLAKRSPTCIQPTSTADYTDEADFNIQMRDWHNYLRCHHNAPAMMINANLVNDAQDWAEEMAELNIFKHSSRCGVGENIALRFSGSKFPAYKVVRGDARSSYRTGWYCSEYANYDPNYNGYQGGAGHFTQVIWKLSTELGCGVAQNSAQTRTYIVCMYGPVGQMWSKKCWTDGYAVEEIQGGSGNYAIVCPDGVNPI